MRPVIVGTAGHIDHGKTALVHRLTGIDTDRLKEEKERGISIDLGFAHLALPSGRRVGIVDVPGHERFVKNMLAGATGIDVVLLVVAADEGVKPQTREHLAIVDLLGVRRGLVALTKSDLAPAERIASTRAQVEALLQGTVLRGAPIVPVSSVTGAGLPELLRELERAADAVEARDAGRAARLPVDRVFTIEGIGTVVTGTLWSGAIRSGDALELLPSGRPARVRRVEVHDEEVPAAAAGQRTAVAIHGVDRDDVARGDWLVAPRRYRATSLLDVRLRVLEEASRPVTNRARLRVHLGASEVLGRAVLLEGDTLDPGATGLAQIRLETPLVAVLGDRLVVRAYSPAATIAGAVVIDPAPPRRARLGPADRARLSVLEEGSLAQRAAFLAEEGAFAGVRDEEIALRLGVEVATAAAAVAEADGLLRLKDGRALARSAWDAVLARVESEVRRYVEAHQLRAGLPKGELKSLLAREIEGPVFDEALAALVARRSLMAEGDRVRLPGAAPSLGPEEERALDRIEERLGSRGFQPPELAEAVAGLPAQLKPGELVRYLIESGRAVKVTSELIYTRAQWSEIEGRVRRHFETSEALTMADFKNLIQVSRKYSVPLLEHMDRTGLTRREGDLRRPGPKFAGKS